MPTQPKKKYRLSDLLLDEVSFVDRGANPGARVLLFKHAQIAAPSGKPRGTKAMKLMEILKDALASLGVASDEVQKKAQEIGDQIGEVVTKKDHDEAVAKAASDAKTEAEAAAAKDVEKRVEAELKKAKEADEDPDAKIKKGMSPEQLEAFEKLQKDREQDAKRLEKIESERREERLRKRAEPFAKIADADDLVTVFKGLDDEAIEAVEKILEKAAAATAKADSILTKSLGTTEPAKGSALEELRAKAAELAKAEGITHQQAFRRVCETNPALFQKHREEERAN